MSVKTMRTNDGKRVRVRDFGAHNVAQQYPVKPATSKYMPHQGAKEKARRLKNG